MWDDFQIGEPLQTNTAVVIMNGCGLSYNDHEYWWNSRDYGIGGKINRQSPEGKRIGQMIATGEGAEALEAFVLKCALSCVSVDTFAKMIKSVREKAFQEGREDKAAEFRACLGLE